MLNIVNRVEELPWHPTKRWAKRSLNRIKQVVIHQELGEGSVEDVNNYHITPGPNNHLSSEGAPHFAYHYGIEKDGLIITANMLRDITWHTRGQNTKSIGIMLVGNFSSDNYQGTSKPTYDQLLSLEFLLDALCTVLPNVDKNAIFGHSDFGKQVCPGTVVMQLIKDYRG